MIRLTGAGLPKATVGQFVPYLFGGADARSALRQVPCLPTCVGQIDQIPLAMTTVSPATGGALAFSDLKIVWGLASDAGTLQVDGERIAYDGRNLVTGEVLNITRGLNSTVAAHDRGATIYEILSQLVYVVGENPSGFMTKAVTQVYLNGVQKAASDAPVHTINLNNTTLIPGHSVVTITFDMSAVFSAVNPSPIFHGNLAIMGGSDAPAASWWRRLRWWLRTWRRRRPISGAAGFTTDIYTNSASAFAANPGATTYTIGNPAGQVIGTYGAGTAANPLVTIYGAAKTFAPAPTKATAPITAPVIQGAPATPAPAVISYPAPILGTVTVDVEGLQDDASGTITGVASTILDRPAWVSRALLHLAFGETSTARYDLAGSWATTAANQLTAVPGGMKWALRFVPMSLEALRELCGTQGRADLYLQDGVWHYTWRGRTTPVYEITTRTALQDPQFGLTPSTQITTALATTYDIPPYDSTFTVGSTTGQLHYGVRRGRTLNLPWVRDAAMAAYLAQYWLEQWSRPRLTLVASLPWDALALEKVDAVTADVPVMSVFGALRMTFPIRGLQADLDQARWLIQAIEGEPAGLEFLTGYRMLQAMTGLTLQTGYLVGIGKTVSDMLPISLTEAASLGVTLVTMGADTVELAITEAAEVTFGFAITDTLAVSLDEVATLAATLITSGSDTVALTLTEAAVAVDINVPLSEAQTIELGLTEAAVVAALVNGLTETGAWSLAAVDEIGRVRWGNLLEDGTPVVVPA